MIFKHQMPMFILEYAPNKLFVTGYPAHMYLIDNWEAVTLITDPNTENILKSFAFPIPGFD